MAAERHLHIEILRYGSTPERLENGVTLQELREHIRRVGFDDVSDWRLAWYWEAAYEDAGMEMRGDSKLKNLTVDSTF